MDAILSGLARVEYLLLGAALFAALYFAGRFFKTQRATGSRCRAMLRYFPAISGVAIGLYCLGLIVLFVPREYSFLWLLVPGVGLLLGWNLLRDILAGVVLRFEGTVAGGVRLRCETPRGEVSGRVGRIGLRSFQLTMDTGEQAIVPFSSVSSAVIRRVADSASGRGGAENIVAHRFVLSGREISGADQEAFRKTLAVHALNHPCALPGKPPVVRIQPADANQRNAQDAITIERLSIEVVVYALDTRHATFLEAHTRDFYRNEKLRFAGSDST